MKLYVTGASSFVGAWFCRTAVRAGHEVVGLWHHTPLRLPGVEAVQGDVTRARPPDDADVVVHLAAKVMADDAREQNRQMLNAVLGWGRPVVYGSSTVVHWPVSLPYADSRVEDEARLMGGPLPWLIVRPCAPYGPRLHDHSPGHRESFHQLAGWVRRYPLIPVVGDGRYRRQPVHVEDFARAILGLVEAGTWRRAFDAGGPEALMLREVIHRLARAAGRRVRVVGVPVPVAVWLAERIPGMRPDLVATFATDDVVDPEPLAAASGVSPRPFLAEDVYAEVRG